MKQTHTFTNNATGQAFDVELDIAVNKVAMVLAARCLQSKTGKSQALGGNIKARIVPRPQ